MFFVFFFSFANSLDNHVFFLAPRETYKLRAIPVHARAGRVDDCCSRPRRWSGRAVVVGCEAHQRGPPVRIAHRRTEWKRRTRRHCRPKNRQRDRIQSGVLLGLRQLPVKIADVFFYLFYFGSLSFVCFCFCFFFAKTVNTPMLVRVLRVACSPPNGS